MLRFVLIAACVISTALAIGYGGHFGGHSSTVRQQDDFGNYEFKYDIKDGYGNVNGRQEKGSHGHVLGSYYLGLIDGRHRSVEYQADKLGFRATIKTNEPGTKTSEPAFAPYINTAYGKSIPSGAIQVAHGYGYGGQASYGKEYGSGGESLGQF
ncbi:adult-specific rigid cuticular protein 15.7-like [Tropilaelaps mercedesae]|uniref:Adult-specific rigid cuticular protein 15.7-like n=1 Tax=Tropilaelaps mercedesae TaxID=418985 RepID=A0A1V9WYM7_9ACAR|nr:adult-specific rigid cuticular protein 15.7-like [Tropilaelaps mercedesae]